MLFERVAGAIDEAIGSAAEAKMVAASFDVDEQWNRNDRKGGARYDRATAMAFEAADGSRIATMLHFASHPETLWEHNTLISPDFPGSFRRRTRELAGGVALYFTGPLGAMLTPNVSPKATPPRTAGLRRTHGCAPRRGDSSCARIRRFCR